MPPDYDMLWRRCALLGRVVLPLVDQEPRRQDRRRERLRGRGVSTVTGERLIEIFAALAAHAVAVDGSLSAEELDALPLKEVADAATGKQDYELLAGLPDTLADDRDGLAVSVFRLYAYKGGQYSMRLHQLGAELHRALVVLAEHAPVPCRTCGDALRRAAEVGLPQ